MEEIEVPDIPDEFVEFAKEVADLADKKNLDKFTMKFRPSFRSSCYVRGEMKIVYSSVDGRGRPCRNLSIELDAPQRHVIEKNQPSSS